MDDHQALICIRVGDGDDYHTFKDMDGAAAYLLTFGVKEVWRENTLGVGAIDFEGRNYISLYWSDVEFEPVRGFTEEELGKLNGLFW